MGIWWVGRKPGIIPGLTQALPRVLINFAIASTVEEAAEISEEAKHRLNAYQAVQA